MKYQSRVEYFEHQDVENLHMKKVITLCTLSKFDGSLSLTIFCLLDLYLEVFLCYSPPPISFG